ncbi:MAG TPA: hypothetical protein VGM05_13905 [Planctomycetaceae bacterium]
MDGLPVFIPVTDADVRRKLDEARGDVVKLREMIEELQGHVENQGILLRALFLLVQEKHGITEAELLDRFRTALGERAPPKMCFSCGRSVNLKFQRCMYCDKPQPVTSAFELV